MLTVHDDNHDDDDDDEGPSLCVRVRPVGMMFSFEVVSMVCVSQTVVMATRQ